MTASPEMLEALDIHYIDTFDGARNSSHPQTRLAETITAGLKFREAMLDGRRVHFYQTIDLVRVPYPTKYGLRDAFRLPTPFMHILNRLFVVQFQTHDGLKTLLFSPSDLDGNRETPYFKRLSESMGPAFIKRLAEPLMAPILCTVESALDRIGLRPDQIDYISYDHLHTQDLRKWLGTATTPAYFPKAKLLVMDQEWTSTEALLPPQKDWYCPNGISGIPEEKIIRLAKSVRLGESVALVATPGHTEGNHSLVAHTPEGLLVSSENGVCADSFAPLHSKIPGVREYALDTGMDIVLNGNTLERGLDQYLSMVLERTIAGPSKLNPNFYNVVPSSELSRYWAFPGLEPTFSFGPLCFGEVHR